PAASPPAVFDGSGDGAAFAAVFSSSCPGISGTASGAKCSNGMLDPGEQCDDGNAVSGDCCSDLCAIEPAGQACNDGNQCSTGDVCAGGTCAGSPAPGLACTSDGNPCTDDVCDAASACTHQPNTNPCNDGDQCTTGDVCAGGTCAGSPAPGQAGNDGNEGTTGDVCAGGTCAGSPAPGQACNSDGNDCSEDVCDAAGVCTHTGVVPVCAGTIDLTGTWYLSWSDPYLDDPHLRAFIQTGAVLTTTLFQGQTSWMPGAINPVTGDFTANTLLPNPGCLEIITGTAAPSGDEFSGTAACIFGFSGVGPAAVTGVKCACASDGNPCTDDICDATGACTYVPNTNPCDDGDACSTGDVCAGGTCVGSPWCWPGAPDTDGDKGGGAINNWAPKG